MSHEVSMVGAEPVDQAATRFTSGLLETQGGLQKEGLGSAIAIEMDKMDGLDYIYVKSGGPYDFEQKRNPYR